MTMAGDATTIRPSSSSSSLFLNDTGGPFTHTLTSSGHLPLHQYLPHHPHPYLPSSSSFNDTFVTATTEETSLTEEEIWAILERLNRERAVYFLPAIVWVVLLMVVGVVGNVLVIYVYRRRFKRTSSNYFILTMAIFDLVACLIGLPTELYDLLNPFTFYSEFGCKLFRGTENFTIYGSVVVLVEIAFDRYFKICRPLMVISLFKIKVLCALAVLVAVMMSVPSVILVGITRSSTPHPDIRGYDCSVSDTYRKTAFSTAYYICLAVAFVVTLVILTALYVRIWLELRQRRRMIIGDQLTKPRGDHGEEGAAQAKKPRVRYIPSMSDEEMLGPGSRFNSATQLNTLTPSSTATAGATNGPAHSATASSTASLPKRSRFTCLTQYASNMHVSRTTIVLFAVTVAFVLSFLPALAVMVVRTVVKDFEKTQSMGDLAASKFFLKFSFINNAINPIIYSFLNINFRRHARKAVEKLFCCCCCRARRHRHMPQKTDSDRSTKKEFLHV